MTAAYAALVYFQLREMERQRRQQQILVDEQTQIDWEQRPILAIGGALVRLAPEVVSKTGEQVGIGCYVNLPLTNVGKRLARLCQPMLTAVGSYGANGWERQPNWLSLNLSWALDELAYISLLCWSSVGDS